MNTAISIAEILGHGVEIRSSEAVAIAQRLTHTEALDVDVQGPLGPPAPDNVFVNPDGSVVCRGCSITPAVSEIGILLDTMLRRTTKVPGGLRYLIARALL